MIYVSLPAYKKEFHHLVEVLSYVKEVRIEELLLIFICNQEIVILIRYDPYHP